MALWFSICLWTGPFGSLNALNFFFIDRLEEMCGRGSLVTDVVVVFLGFHFFFFSMLTVGNIDRHLVQPCTGGGGGGARLAPCEPS